MKICAEVCDFQRHVGMEIWRAFQSLTDKHSNIIIASALCRDKRINGEMRKACVEYPIIKERSQINTRTLAEIITKVNAARMVEFKCIKICGDARKK